jgi:hypothetical protein
MFSTTLVHAAGLGLPSALVVVVLRRYADDGRSRRRPPVHRRTPGTLVHRHSTARQIDQRMRDQRPLPGYPRLP